MNTPTQNKPQKITPPDRDQAGPAAAEVEDLPNPLSSAGATTQAAPPRRERKPFGTTEYRLGYPERPGYVRRWFNDEPGRIDRAIQAGYDFVKDRDGKNVSLVVDKGANGAGMNGYLMEIPREFYDEDFAAKQALLDEVDHTIQRGAYKSEGDDRRYGGVNMTSTVGHGHKSRRPMAG